MSIKEMFNSKLCKFHQEVLENYRHLDDSRESNLKMFAYEFIRQCCNA